MNNEELCTYDMEYDVLTVTTIIYDQKYVCINYPAKPNDVLMLI